MSPVYRGQNSLGCPQLKALTLFEIIYLFCVCFDEHKHQQMRSYDHVDLRVCAIVIHCGSRSEGDFTGTPEI